MPELLYHGSVVIVKNIDISIGAPHKDFGKGFYTTSSEHQARRFVKIKAKRERLLTGYLNIYEYAPDTTLNIKRFKKADEEWLDFVLANRRHSRQNTNIPAPQFDIIIGPVANDAVGLVLNQLLIGTYGDPDLPEARQTAIRLLETEKLYDQVFFGTMAAVECLTFKEAIPVEINE
jgi:hypothetical protein